MQQQPRTDFVYPSRENCYLLNVWRIFQATQTAPLINGSSHTLGVFVFHLHSDRLVRFYLHADFRMRCLERREGERVFSRHIFEIQRTMLLQLCLRFQTCDVHRLFWCHDGLDQTVGTAIRPHPRTTKMNLFQVAEKESQHITHVTAF